MDRSLAKTLSSAIHSAGRIVRFILAAYGLCLLLILYSPVADYLVRPLRVPADPRPAPAIVVLTAWVSPDGALNEQAMRRTHTAARLYREGLAPLVVMSGGDPGAASDPQAADFMAQFAGELGVPRSAILLEKKSHNTYTSGVQVRELCRQLGIDRVLLVTDAVHMRRAIAAFRAQNLAVSPIPADPGALGWETPLSRLRKFLGALHEYGGLLYYRWKGWI
jgi:uncharacterized SAM-binding protein YcdF (DUF218 family)